MSICVEYERKFVIENLPKKLIIKEKHEFEQKYLSGEKDGIIVRIRRDFVGKFMICIKKVNDDKNLIEYENEISLDEYSKLSLLAKNIIKKTRLTVYSELNKMDYFIDVFHEKLEGLMIAEIETVTGDNNKINEFVTENFFKKEISTNKRYSNLHLAYLGIPFEIKFKRYIKTIKKILRIK